MILQLSREVQYRLDDLDRGWGRQIAPWDGDKSYRSVAPGQSHDRRGGEVIPRQWCTHPWAGTLCS